MKRLSALAIALAAGLLTLPLIGADQAPASNPLSDSLQPGKLSPKSISALAFAPDGTLFIGDSRGGAVYAVATAGEKAQEAKAITVTDLEAKIAARLGTKASEVMIHDLATHPISHHVFLAVSRGRGGWDSGWKLPNHVADADILLTVNAAGEIAEFSLDNVRHARAELPNPVSADKKHRWMENTTLRSDTITDMAYTEDTLFVSGLSNEEFASTLWRVPLPFADGTSATTLEIYHGAHGEYETHAPIRTFVPYSKGGEEHILAAYLCTPLSVFKVKDLEDKAHVKGRTIAEFGSGNYPLDMVMVEHESGNRLFIANSNLPLIIVKTEDIDAYEGEITERPETYAAGVEHLKRSGTGIQQLDVMDNRFLVTLKRMPSGTLDLGSLALRRG